MTVEEIGPGTLLALHAQAEADSYRTSNAHAAAGPFSIRQRVRYHVVVIDCGPRRDIRRVRRLDDRSRQLRSRSSLSVWEVIWAPRRVTEPPSGRSACGRRSARPGRSV